MNSFGSFYLQTDDFESDIDSILCTYNEQFLNKKLVKILDHDNGTFFDRFYKYLEKDESVQSIYKVEEAQVPLIKLTINSVEIDLLLCSKTFMASELSDSSETTNKKSFNSVQGLEATRVLEKIASSILNGDGLIVFREVTKLVKYFCKSKGIYGANLCYLNGMSIQIMVICVMETIYLMPKYKSKEMEKPL